MENNSNGTNGKRIRAEDVICKLKDDGDFDKLRLKILRKIKENEELRNSIIATVKESAALNRPGAENMKPRQLSDAIYQEVGDKVMGKISEDLWNTIRTGDGIQTEITQTVQSVYNKLLYPQLNEAGESSSHSELQPAPNGIETNGHSAASDSVIDATVSVDAEPNEPPGFARLGSDRNSKSNCSNQINKSNHKESPKEKSGVPVPADGKARETNTESETNCAPELFGAPELLVPDSMDVDAPPGFAIVTKEKNLDDVDDEDPDVPPGFG
ncbi:uncharacterized protein [Nicotiana sylvestris]|uniref:Uncharacterized protein LOC104225979 n=1 Tax=Nicotiana sylvestris TaxID=4096 RepID=A0A1U7WNB4_NICSY|nr:PREDICTED: uncharacterized protein LOC104225979 [Nicotiana sylvestris]